MKYSAMKYFEVRYDHLFLYLLRFFLLPFLSFRFISFLPSRFFFPFFFGFSNVFVFLQLLSSITPNKAEMAVNHLAPLFLVSHPDSGGGAGGGGAGGGGSGGGTGTPGGGVVGGAGQHMNTASLAQAMGNVVREGRRGRGSGGWREGERDGRTDGQEEKQEMFTVEGFRARERECGEEERRDFRRVCSYF